jgi:hypothetical protein
MTDRAFPLSPRSTRDLEVGDCWAIQLADGTFGVCQVTDLRRSGQGARTTLVAGVIDWSGSATPTVGDLAGRPVLAQGLVRIEVFTVGGAVLLGNVPLNGDGRILASPFRDFEVGTVTQTWGWKVLPRRVAQTLGRA